MTDQTIIDDASKQAQSEVVIIDNVAAGIINGKRQALPMGTKLFTTPPQPQTLADALEEAAKICDGLKQSVVYADESPHEQYAFNEGVKRSVVAIRNLITTQPTQMKIPDGLKLVPIEPTAEMSSFNNTGVHWQIAERIYKAMLDAAPSIQGNTEGEK